MKHEAIDGSFSILLKISFTAEWLPLVANRLFNNNLFLPFLFLGTLALPPQKKSKKEQNG
jgi:hypothetical protein